MYQLQDIAILDQTPGLPRNRFLIWFIDDTKYVMTGGKVIDSEVDRTRATNSSEYSNNLSTIRIDINASVGD